MNHEPTTLMRPVALVALAALAVTGCATTTTTGAAPGSSTASTTTAASGPAPSIYCGKECQAQLALKADPASIPCSVGVSWNSALHPYGARHTQQIPQFAAQYFPNMKVTVTEAQGDGNKQSGQVDDLIAQGVKVLINPRRRRGALWRSRPCPAGRDQDHRRRPQRRHR